MTATDALRRLLDERGAEYRVSATGYSIDIGPHITAYANRSNTTLDMSMRNITPEQAVEATLGRGECHVAPFMECSECGAQLDGIYGRYCPNCGRKVVDA